MHNQHQHSSQRLLCILLFTLLLLLMQCTLTYTCPAEVCICKWKGGKQTVECGGQQLPNIPEGMDPGTQVLNFSGNSLQVLQSERFLRMDLLNLQKIYLSRNQLIRIHEKAFRGLTNLVELDLTDNSLQNVPTETFQDYSSLMRLSLSGNPIRELKTSAFRHLSFLTTLELSNCQIERIENEAFIGMDNLEWLRLDGNRIGFIQGPHILPKSLHGISLQSNRWMCDCRLLDLHAWLNTYVTPQVEEPKCVEPPRLKGQVIKTLKKDELACLPEVTPASSYTEISEGRNVSIMCVVRAIPEPQVLWLFNGQVMSNDSLIDNLHMYYYIDESSSPEEKRSEIFIYNVGAEDNGTFSCVGKNVAGITFSNYTLRVIIKEPPVVNEVSFPHDYMNYIIASSTGAGVIFAVMLCTIVIKCKQRQPKKRKKCGGSNGSVTNVGSGNTHATDSSGNETGLMKCSSILNDGDSMNGGAGLLMAEGMTPTKLCKENGGGGVIIGGQMKQNLLLYAPAHYQQQTPTTGASAGETLQLSVNMSHGASGTPPPALLVGGNALSYCSPPSSVRNYHQEKNPDLVNDAAESVNHNKLKTAASLDANDYDAASVCSGPCSIQGLSLSSTPVPYENNTCYQLTAAAPQYGSQIIRPTNMQQQQQQQQQQQLSSAAASRFAAMTTLPRGMQLKTLMNSMSMSPAPQHQVDVHLNPVCFLGQDGFAYDYSNAHMQQSAPPPPSHHHHLQLQPQFSLGSAGADTAQQQHMQQQQQQQNFYRTLPHNRAHKQQQFAASAAANAGMRYSLEAEFVQRSGAPAAYDKYTIPNVRFTAEGYPQAQQQHIVQYPSPPEGYKSCQSPTGGSAHDGAVSGASTISNAATFQQWPPCLPGYHVQAIRYPQTIVGVLSPQAHTQQPHHQQKQQQQQQQSMLQKQQLKSATTIVLSPNGDQKTKQTQVPTTTNAATSASVVSQLPATSATTTKRCVAAQADSTTIPECDENDVSPTTSTAASSSMDGSGSSCSNSSSSSSATTVTISACNTTATTAATATATATEESSKLRHLNGPLADSPDEGYVGDSHEGSDI